MEDLVAGQGMGWEWFGLVWEGNPAFELESAWRIWPGSSVVDPDSHGSASN
jgi:hypothetical protein